MSQITQRKQDHIDAVLNDPQVERQQSEFDEIQLIHRALPELDFAAIDTQTQFLGKTISFPFMIASMTGGAAQNLQQINRHLAEAAEACQVPMAVGSQRAMILDQAARDSFELRRYAPTAPLIANIGAVQLNYGFGTDQAQQAIDILEADALYLHLNPLQELIQPEGDTNFNRLSDKIAELVDALEVPVILKEVGCGLSPADIELGLKAGIRHFDVAGRGGTSWSRIEAHRAQNDLGFLFQDWGLTTLQSLAGAQPYQEQADFIASGGIRNGIDMIKAVIMGGRLCSVAAPLLTPALESTQAVVAKIEQFKQEFATAQFLLGVPTSGALHLKTELVFRQPNSKC
ncbi:type 2 isopentenyl-diphosphate Delta-isomerase [Thiomicrorhabdus sp. ZW0627]|uniref:type 2 isopentenyl-diphosphate Delta-isomerase n=1 Tax=Thiomicrorhabdus sp. ZW0627 TaxID=3039774 RepID=UPI0024369733|nr:type 2 isopentenyl-diphosphate Delta-isomerase [Thiomicrorhabdus sp. ZW0627]MDG6773966.1 type 2 isopentenyl-diphosphate Delta-isomerase [Thiomicrorhabdus sp. ZW0627]